MKKFLIISLVLIGILAAGGIYAYGVYKEVSGALVGGEISAPKKGGWDKLKEGQSLKEVQALLGDGVPLTITQNEVSSTSLIYTWSDGLIAAISHKSHALFFENDKLTSWHKPMSATELVTWQAALDAKEEAANATTAAAESKDEPAKKADEVKTEIESKPVESKEEATKAEAVEPKTAP